MLNVLSVQHYSKTYRSGVKGADDVCFDVEAGTVFCLLGPNGSGKSTIINYLAGLIKPDSGSFFLFGERFTHHQISVLRRLGFVLQKYHFIENLRIQEYLHFSGCLYGMKTGEIRKRTDDLLDFFNMGDRRNAMIHTLSSGMKKRLSLIRALIHGPDLLILDEPFEGIDPLFLRRIASILSKFAKANKTVIIATHHLGMVEKCCDATAVMDHGRIITRCGKADIHRCEGKRTVRQTGRLEKLYETIAVPVEYTDGLGWLYERSTAL